jgi:hypothetical protein
MGEVAVKQNGILTPTNMGEAIQFAEMVAVSKFCPKDFVGKPGDILVAVQWASEVGLSPFTALQNMAVINGKPSLYGDGLLAVITGHKEYVSHKEWREGDEAFCTIVRMRFGEKVETTRSFSMGQAKRAGLLGKGPWQQYTERMLQMRARGFAARDSFPDALSGMVIKEEAEDYPTGSNQPRDITDQVVEVPANPLDATFGADTPETDPQISPVSDDDAVLDTDSPENADASDDAIQDTSGEIDERAWEMSVEDGFKEYPNAQAWADAMIEAWGVIEADESMRFVDRRHEIGEHKKDHDDTVDRLKSEKPDVAGQLGAEYKKILARLSAKAKEAGEVKKKEKVK